MEKAYLLGIIQSDGSIRAGAPQISITQHKDFSWYLQAMIKTFIRPSAKRGKDRNCHQITFSSTKLHRDLVSKGVIPNKTHVQTERDIAKLWESVPLSLIPSFLRGLLDGDGCIRFFRQKNRSKTDSCHVGWCGNKFLMQRISAYLAGNYCYNPSVLKVSGCKTLYRTTITTPAVGEELVKAMLVGFRWPYGHPIKTAAMIERVGGEYPIAEFGDPKFKVVLPAEIKDSPRALGIWLRSMVETEEAYSRLRLEGCSPQIARAVLPNCLKTEIVMTANLREWRHFIGLRGSVAAHPQIRPIATAIHNELMRQAPAVFADLNPTE